VVPVVAAGPATAASPAVLAADGNTRAAYAGTGVSYGQITGRRALIRVSGDAVLSVGGRAQAVRGTRAAWVTGRWSVTGVRPTSTFRVEVGGPVWQSFCAAGTGTVRLEGRGTYRTDAAAPAGYTRVVTVALSQTPRANARRNRNAILPPAPPAPPGVAAAVRADRG
jgi:hypothetical protein